MIRLGIIGLNEGNGHPYSYSAIFNGYDPTELSKRCPYDLIKQYLPREHRNEVFLEGAKVTHIWTQSRELSKDVAAVSLIPHVVNSLGDLIGKVDAVILARDDPWNHLEMALPFLKYGMPLFIDKQLVANVDELDHLMSYVGPSYPLMAGSSARYTRDLESFEQHTSLDLVKTIHGVSRSTWMRYGHHLLEGIIKLWGTDVYAIRSLSTRSGHDILQICYQNGPNVILEFVENIGLPIQFTCFIDNQISKTVPFTDYFHSFQRMLRDFVGMVQKNSGAVRYQETLFIAKLVIAGSIAQQTNRPISPLTMTPVESI